MTIHIIVLRMSISFNIKSNQCLTYSVPPRMMSHLFSKCGSLHKELLQIAGGTHNDTWTGNGWANYSVAYMHCSAVFNWRFFSFLFFTIFCLKHFSVTTMVYWNFWRNVRSIVVLCRNRQRETQMNGQKLKKFRFLVKEREEWKGKKRQEIS